MKKITIALLISTMTLSWPAQTRAAEPSEGLSLFSLSYVLSIPTASTSDFVDHAVSYRGIGVEWTNSLGVSDLYWGLSFRWLYFQNVEDQGTYTVGNTTATGRLYRSIDSFPIAAHLKYPLSHSSDQFLPFIGLGVGATYGMRELNIGALSNNEYGWQFLLVPEIGTQFTFAKGKGAHGFFNIRYDAGFGNDSIKSITNLSFAIGLGTPI